MQINVPAQIRARMTEFRTTGKMEGEQKEALSPDTVGGAALVIGSVAGSYESLDETEFDLARNQPNLVKLGPETLASEPAYQMREATAVLEQQGDERTVTVGGVNESGSEAYQQYVLTSNSLSLLTAEVVGGEVKYNTIRVEDNHGEAGVFKEQWNLAH